MTYGNETARARALRGETIRDADGNPVGCRLVDRHGIMDASAGACATWELVTRGPDAGLRLAVEFDLGEEPILGPDATVTGFLRGIERLGRAAAEDGRMGADATAALQALEPFLQTLDPGAVSDCKRMDPGLDWDAYALLDRSVDPVAPLAAALAAEPHLARTAISLARANVARMREAAIGGRPAMSAYLIGEATARRQSRRFEGTLRATLDAMDAMGEPAREELAAAVRCAGTDAPDPALAVAGVLARVPPEWMPRDAAGWLDMAACMPAAMFAWRRPMGRRIAAGLGGDGDWHALRGRLAKWGRTYLDHDGEAPGGPAASVARGLRSALDDAGDMAAAFIRQVVAPALALAGDGEARLPDLAGFDLMSPGRGVGRLLEDSHSWHSHVHEALAAMPTDGEYPSTWKAGYPDATYGDVAVRVLASAAGLKAEGGTGGDADGVPGLSHCVGAYAGQCLSGRCRILSLRRLHPDGTWSRLATAELEPPVPGHVPYVRQMRGRGNARFHDDALVALSRYGADIQVGRLQVDADAFAPVPVPAALREAGYDWRVPGNWERVRDLWRPYMARPLRSAGHEAFAAAAAAHPLSVTA